MESGSRTIQASVATWRRQPSRTFNHPRSNRGAGLVFGNFAIGTAERIGASLAQEFLLGRFTRRGGHLKGSE
jgi:hypothetical protein